MVARGDLGIEIAIESLPNVQRELVHTCARLGRRCIVATHLLESMIENPIPTRAEVTDVANAIYEGVDAVMLSAETSVGRYPVRCVEQLARIATASEKFPGLGFAREFQADTDKHHLAIAAAGLAEAIAAAGIVVITRRGVMADLVTSCQPPHVPIYVFTNNSQARRRLMLNRGVYAHRTAFSTQPEKNHSDGARRAAGTRGPATGRACGGDLRRAGPGAGGRDPDSVGERRLARPWGLRRRGRACPVPSPGVCTGSTRATTSVAPCMEVAPRERSDRRCNFHARTALLGRRRAGA